MEWISESIQSYLILIFQNKCRRSSFLGRQVNEISPFCILILLLFKAFLGVILDKKLKLKSLIELKSINRSYLPRKSLVAIYKSFVIPDLSYGDVMYDPPNNTNVSQKTESVQYNVALTITRT